MNFNIGDIVIVREPPFEGLGKIYDIEEFNYNDNFYNILVVFDEYIYTNSIRDIAWIDSYIWTNITYLVCASSLEKELF